MKISITLPNDVKKIINMLEDNYFSAYVVGGALRDAILSRPVKDWDICTSATPEQIMEVFKDEHIIPTGLQHGTVTIMLNGIGYEVTTYRNDGNYSDGRHPDNVEFVSNIEEDLSRRDFTINAMAYNPKVGLVDPFGGLEDLQKRIIRCVGSPYDRFNEDALRIMRALRFASQLNFILHQDAICAIDDDDLISNLENISAERINSELCKTLSGNRPTIIMLYKKVLCKIISEFEPAFGFPQYNPYHVYSVSSHICESLKMNNLNDLIVKLALLFHDIGKPYCYQDDENGIRHFKGHSKVSADMTNEIMRRLKFDNNTREKVVELVYYHDATLGIDKKYIKRWLNKIGEDQFRRLLKVRIADIKAQNFIYETERLAEINKIENILETVLSEKQCFTLKDLAINGNDVKKVMMLKEGKDVGYWLNKILNRVIDGKLSNNKKDLIYWMIGVADGWIKP